MDQQTSARLSGRVPGWQAASQGAKRRRLRGPLQGGLMGAAMGLGRWSLQDLALQDRKGGTEAGLEVVAELSRKPEVLSVRQAG